MNSVVTTSLKIWSQQKSKNFRVCLHSMRIKHVLPNGIALVQTANHSGLHLCWWVGEIDLRLTSMEKRYGDEFISKNDWDFFSPPRGMRRKVKMGISGQQEIGPVSLFPLIPICIGIVYLSENWQRSLFCFASCRNQIYGLALNGNYRFFCTKLQLWGSDVT